MIKRLIKLMHAHSESDSEASKVASDSTRGEAECERTIIHEANAPAASDSDPRIYFGGCC